MATINLPKSPHFKAILKVSKSFMISSEIIFGQLFIDIWRFFYWSPSKNRQTDTHSLVVVDNINRQQSMNESIDRPTGRLTT